MPEGGDQVPSAFLAMRMPEPPEPDIHRPERIHEKMARPAAFCIILGGMFLATSAGVGGREVGLRGRESGSTGTR